MNNSECNEVYQLLTDMINQLGLGWISAQVQEQLQLGKTIQREIETLKESDLKMFQLTGDEYRSQLKKGPKAIFPVTVNYEPSERLLLLIDAIEQAIVNTAEMEHHLFKCFDWQKENLEGRIEFHSEDPNIQSKSIDKITAERRLEN